MDTKFEGIILQHDEHRRSVINSVVRQTSGK